MGVYEKLETNKISIKFLKKEVEELERLFNVDITKLSEKELEEHKQKIKESLIK